MRSPTIHLATALIVLVGALSLYGAWYATLSKKSAAVASLEEQIRTKTETSGRIAAARAALAEIAGEEQAVRAYFVSETGVVPFIDALEASGRAQGATLNVLSVADASDATHPSLDVSISVKGSFDAVMRTLGSIEYAPYAITFTRFSVSLDGKNAWRADVTLNVGSAPNSGATAATPK